MTDKPLFDLFGKRSYRIRFHSAASPNTPINGPMVHEERQRDEHGQTWIAREIVYDDGRTEHRRVKYDESGKELVFKQDAAGVWQQI
ncbi:MAG: hypothetical protein WCO56_25020 [Verrucomicrobiota bacterium]